MEPSGGGADRPEVSLLELLAARPDAVVVAIDGAGLFVPMPDSVPAGAHPSSNARSGLDLVQPGARMDVVSAWRRVLEEGVAATDVTLAGSGVPATLTFFDVRPTHGVLVGVLAAVDPEAGTCDAVTELRPSPPRLARSRKNERAVLTDADDRFTQMLGWEQEEIVGRRSIDFIHPDDQERAILLWMEGLSQPGSTSRARLRHLHRDGRWIWLDITNHNLLADPEHGFVDCEMVDISDEMQAHEAIRASEQLLRRLAGALPVGVVHFDAWGRILYANERMYETFGAAPDVEPATLLRCIVDQAVVPAAVADVVAGRDVDTELLIDRLDGGGRRRCTLTLRALTNDEGAVTGGVGCLADVTDAVRMQVELERRATYDSLTGCVNRESVLATLSSVLEPAGVGSGGGLAVAFIDLDGFKGVNDRFGHTVGDGLLVAVAARLRAAVRGADIVGRIGGDEFLAVCTGVTDEATARSMGERMAAAVSEPLTIDAVHVSPRASIGVAWTSHRAGLERDALVAEADAAMYAAKHAADGRPVVAETRQRRPVALRSS